MLLRRRGDISRTTPKGGDIIVEFHDNCEMRKENSIAYVEKHLGKDLNYIKAKLSLGNI